MKLISQNPPVMKKTWLFLLVIAFVSSGFAQDLPKDVKKIYKSAEKLQKKQEYDKAIEAYKEVLRSVPNHYKSHENIGDIESRLKARPNYRQAAEAYKNALDVIDGAIVGTNQDKVKNYLQNERKRILPKFNKAKSHVKDFDRAKQNREKGNRLLEDEDL